MSSSQEVPERTDGADIASSVSQTPRPRVGPNAKQVSILETKGPIQPAGQGGGISVPGTFGNVRGDIVGGNKISVFVQGIDTEIPTDISASQNLVQALEFLRGDITRLRSADERFVFEAAKREAEEMCDAGRPEDASRAFTEALDREDRAEQQRQEYHRRFRIRLLEEAIVYDRKASSPDAAFAKVCLVAQAIHPEDRTAQTRYLSSRASEYRDQGKSKGDNAALLIAVAILDWLLKSGNHVRE
jgi:hypothetical protein